MICSKCNVKTIVTIAVVIALVVGGLFIFKGKSNKSAETSSTGHNAKANHNVSANSTASAVSIEDAHLSPENLVSVYIDALSGRDTETMYAIMAEPVCQQKEGEEQNTVDYYTPYMEEVDRFYGDNAKFSVKINNVEYGAPRDDMYEEEYIEDVAFVDCHMIINRGDDTETTEQHLPCIKIDGKWYIDD